MPDIVFIKIDVRKADVSSKPECNNNYCIYSSIGRAGVERRRAAYIAAHKADHAACHSAAPEHGSTVSRPVSAAYITAHIATQLPVTQQL